jgi:membrane-bound serine protease (ClpP class)
LLLVLAVLAGLLWIPFPWDLLFVIGAAVVEAGEVWFWFWWTRRRRPVVGAEALVGETAVASTALDPGGYVRVEGELWQARSERPVAAGESVVIAAVEPDLTLMVEPKQD